MICPRILYTVGEPAGIGPDIIIRIAQQYQPFQLITIADPDVIQQRAEQLGIRLTLRIVTSKTAVSPTLAGELYLIPIAVAEPVIAGQLNKKNGQSVINSLTHAVKLLLNKQAEAIVTGPINKAIINEAGIAFTGHTEFFAEQSNTKKVVMLLSSPKLKVALVTTHLPLRLVSDAITYDEIVQTIAIVATSLQQQWRIVDPKIAVCGLNPHAGESGHLGHEELMVIKPAIKAMERKGILVSGPWPADTIFVGDNLKKFDVVVAMYHDQGLPVLKHQGFAEAVNITLGLPFIRTSVDHGTALSLAGTSAVKTGSAEAALNTALAMVR